MSSCTVSPRPYPNNRLSPEDEKKNVSEAIKPLIEWIEKNHSSYSTCSFPKLDSSVIQEKINKTLSFSVWAVTPYGPISWEEIRAAVSPFNPIVYFCEKDALKFLGIEYCKDVLNAWGIPKDKTENALTFPNFNSLLKRPPPHHLPTLIIEVDQFPQLEELPGKAQAWKSIDWDGTSAIITTVSDATHRYTLHIHLRLRQATLGETYFRLYPDPGMGLEVDKTFFPGPIASSFFALLLNMQPKRPPVQDSRTSHYFGIKNPTLIHVEESLAHPDFLPVEIKINREKNGIAEIISHVQKISDPIKAFALSIQICLQLRNQWLAEDVECLWNNLFNFLSPIHFENENILSYLYQIFDRNRELDQSRHNVGESRLALVFRENTFTFAEVSALLELLCVCVQMTGLEKILVHNGEYKIRCQPNLWLSIPDATQSWNCIKNFKINSPITEFEPFQKLLTWVLQEHYFAKKVKVPSMNPASYSKLQQMALFFVEKGGEPLLLFGYCLYNLSINASEIDQREADLYCLSWNFNYIQFLSPSRLKNLLEFNQKSLNPVVIDPLSSLDIDALIKEASIPTPEDDEELEETTSEIPKKSINLKIWKKLEEVPLHLQGPVVDNPEEFEPFEMGQFAWSFSFSTEPLQSRLELKLLFSVIDWKLKALPTTKELPLLLGKYFLKKLLEFLNRPHVSDEDFNMSLSYINTIIDACADEDRPKLFEKHTIALVTAFSKHKGTSTKFKMLIRKLTPLIKEFLENTSTLWITHWISIAEKTSLFPAIFQSWPAIARKKILEAILYEHQELNAANEARVRLFFPLIDKDNQPLICKAIILKLSYKKTSLEKNEYWLNKWLELNKPADPKTTIKKHIPFINSLTTFLENENRLTETRWWNIWSKFFKDKHIPYQTWEKPIEKLCKAFIQKQKYKAIIDLFSKGEVLSSGGYKIFETFLLEAIRKPKKTKSIEELEFLWFLYARSPSIDPRNQNTFLEIFFKNPDKNQEMPAYRQVLSRAFSELNSGILPHTKRFSNTWKSLWMQFYNGNKWLVNESLIQDKQWVTGILSSKECQSIANDTLHELLVTSGTEKFLYVWSFCEQLSGKIKTPLTNSLRWNLVDYFIRVAQSPSSGLLNEKSNKDAPPTPLNLPNLTQKNAEQTQSTESPPPRLIEDARTKMCLNFVISNLKQQKKKEKDKKNWVKLFDRLIIALIRLQTINKYINKLKQTIIDTYLLLPTDRMEPINQLFACEDPIIVELCKDFLIQVIEKKPPNGEPAIIFNLVEAWTENAKLDLYLELCSKLKTPSYVQCLALLRIYKKSLALLRKKYDLNTPMSNENQKIASRIFKSAYNIAAKKDLPYAYQQYYLLVVLNYLRLHFEVPMPSNNINTTLDTIYAEINRFISDVYLNQTIYRYFKKFIDNKIAALKKEKNRSLIKLIGSLHQYIVQNLNKFGPTLCIDYITFISDHLLDINLPFNMIQTYQLEISRLPEAKKLIKEASESNNPFLVKEAQSAFHKLSAVLVVQDKEIVKTPHSDHCADIEKALEYLVLRMATNLNSAQKNEKELADCLEIFCKIVIKYKSDLFDEKRGNVFYPFKLLISVLDKIPFPVFMRPLSEEPAILLIQRLLSLYHPRAYVLNDEFKEFSLKKNSIFFQFAQSFCFSEFARNVTYHPLFPVAQEQFLLLVNEWDYNKKSHLHFNDLDAFQISICKLLSGHFLLTRDVVECSKANYDKMHEILKVSCPEILFATLQEIANMVENQQKIQIAND